MTLNRHGCLQHFRHTGALSNDDVFIVASTQNPPSPSYFVPLTYLTVRADCELGVSAMKSRPKVATLRREDHLNLMYNKIHPWI
ncbi:hypothetical protein [Synechococcus sp. M16CYN]|uniref:hypothetical protein n=1 Tax=Synechococcus sp. M16CYN TaxID=3103139 RepID=UPI00333E299E